MSHTHCVPFSPWNLSRFAALLLLLLHSLHLASSKLSPSLVSDKTDHEHQQRLDFSSNNYRDCEGKALFRSHNIHRREHIYRVKFDYDCSSSDFQHKLEQLKRRQQQDEFVDSFTRHRRNLVDRFDELGSGSSDYDVDDDTEDDDEEYDRWADFLEPSEPPTLDPLVTSGISRYPQGGGAEDNALSKYVPNVPTPVVDDMIVSTNNVNSVSTSVPQLTREAMTPSFGTSSSSSSGTTPNEELTDFSPHGHRHNDFLGSGDFEPIAVTPVMENVYNIGSSTAPATVTVPSTTTTSTTVPKPLRRLKKQLIQSGSVYRQTMPSRNCVATGLTDWVSVVDNQLTAVASEDEISDWEFEVECEDVIYEMYFAVRQRQKSRQHNHLVRLEFGAINRSIEALASFVEKLAGRSPANVVVIQYNVKSYPFFVEFVNETFVSLSQGSCSMSELDKALDVIRSSTYDYAINSVEIVKSCDEDVDLRRPPPGPTATQNTNYPPSIKNPIDRIDALLGHFLLYKVQDDFCYDPEDGRNVRLQLKNYEDFTDVGQSWVQFDTKNAEIFGLPMHMEKARLALVCFDRQGKTTQDVLEILVREAGRSRVNYSVELNLHFDSIPFTPTAIRKFMDILSEVLSPDIEVKSYSESNSHVHFKFYNTTNPSSEAEISELRKVLFSDLGGVRDEVKTRFAPDFNITDSSVLVPLLVHVNKNSESPRNDSTLFDFEDHSNEIGHIDKNLVHNADNDIVFQEEDRTTYLTTYIIPSLLIAVMILLSLIIACLLSRNKSHRDLDEDDYSNKAESYSKNVPVIFQEELDQPPVIQYQQHQPQNLTLDRSHQQQRPPPPPPNYNYMSAYELPPPPVPLGASSKLPPRKQHPFYNASSPYVPP